MTRPIPLLLVLLAVAIPLSLLAGRVWLDPWTTPNAAVIVGELRLPRALLAVIIGGGLGAAGAAMQGYLRNPLADPGLFGIAPGAALGAVLSLLLGYAASAYLLPLFALAGAGGAMLLLALIAGRAGGIALFTLAGMMIASLAGALTSLAISLAPNAFATSEIVVWLMGALTDRGWPDVWLAAPLTLAGLVVLRLAGRGLDALTLGEETAASLGFDPRRTQWLVVGGTALAVGGAVAVTGVVGFVGLVVPHLLRPWVGHHPSRLLLPSFLGGAVLTAVADIAIRLMPPGPELKLGVVTALLGAPFFLQLVMGPRAGAQA